MQTLVHLIEQYGLWFVFFNVLITQAGVPVPSYPTLIVTGALLARGDYNGPQLLIVAAGAALIADLGWYYAGTQFGRPVLRTLCRVSLSPDGCVRQTENIFGRFGTPSLLVAKFIPGFAAVATALAGAIRTPLALFVFFDGIGAALWAGVAIVIGLLFRNAINELLATLAALGRIGLIVILVGFALFVATKWWQRQRFYNELRMARISVEELRELVDAGAAPLILDVRSTISQQEGGRIPGALTISDKAITDKTFEITFPDLATGKEVVVYCACPNDASAARVAKLLKQRGFNRVRPLKGGIDAWVAAGYAVERETA
jgi:membrane protein DedA with SNARE-associated domain/rhodanese-related sulfurtransferase